MHDNSEADDGFAIPAKHARKARIRQKKLDIQREFQFRQPTTPRHKHGTAEAALLSTYWDKEAAPSENWIASKPVQAAKGPPPWGTFLASLANQTQEKPSSKDIVENWAGTLFWNDVWEKSIETEVEEAKKKKQAAVDAARANISNAPGADAVPAAGLPLLAPAAPQRRSNGGHRIPPGPLNTGLLLDGV